MGYIYLSDFNALGSEDLLRQYYPQADKAGLVIDVRGNRGGFTSQWALNLLRRPQAGEFRNREGGVTTLPGAVAPRALAVVMDRFSASDGDQFPYYFAQLQMGPLIGERTWGGVLGIKGPWTLTDGLWVTVPKDALLSTAGEPIIENRGAVPTLPVERTAADYAHGRDPQLERATQAASEVTATSPRRYEASPRSRAGYKRAPRLGSFRGP